MSNSIKISYAIPVCNEHEELDRLLSILVNNIEPNDEIVVLFDDDGWTDEVMDTYREIQSTHNDIFGEYVNVHSLNGDFASHKNYLNSKCSGDWIVQLDADEYVSEVFLANIHTILEENSEIDVIWVPRINTVDGLTDADVKKWGWNVNSDGWVNWPDFQCRTYKNTPEIKWKNKVHEQLTGYTTSSNLPLIEALAIRHPKTIDRQRKQNNFYETL